MLPYVMAQDFWKMFYKLAKPEKKKNGMCCTYLLIGIVVLRNSAINIIRVADILVGSGLAL